MSTVVNHGREWFEAGIKDGFYAEDQDDFDEPRRNPRVDDDDDEAFDDEPVEFRGLMHTILGPDDWLGRHPATCAVILAAAFAFVGWLDWRLA